MNRICKKSPASGGLCPPDPLPWALPLNPQYRLANARQKYKQFALVELLGNIHYLMPVAVPLSMSGMPLHILFHKWVCHRCKIPMRASPRFRIWGKDVIKISGDGQRGPSKKELEYITNRFKISMLPY